MSVSVSIIIPTYNRAQFLPQVVESIQKNTFRDIELFIIDDGSTDETPTVVQKLKQDYVFPIYYFQCSHRGKAGSINYFLNQESISGNYIIFADSDDTLPNQSLEQRYHAITTLQADMIIGAFAVTNLKEKPREVRMVKPNATKKEFLRQFFFSPKTPFHLNSAMISKRLIAQTGGFDERLIRGQEVDYSVRLLKKANKIGVLSEVVYHYRQYYRPLARRLNLRLQTSYCRFKAINKHLHGRHKVQAMAVQAFYDNLKFAYEFFPRYSN